MDVPNVQVAMGGAVVEYELILRLDLLRLLVAVSEPGHLELHIRAQFVREDHFERTDPCLRAAELPLQIGV